MSMSKQTNYRCLRVFLCPLNVSPSALTLVLDNIHQCLLSLPVCSCLVTGSSMQRLYLPTGGFYSGLRRWQRCFLLGSSQMLLLVGLLLGLLSAGIPLGNYRPDCWYCMSWEFHFPGMSQLSGHIPTFPAWKLTPPSIYTVIIDQCRILEFSPPGYLCYPIIRTITLLIAVRHHFR